MAFPANTTRYLLFLCNLLFLVSALAVAAVSVLIAVSLFQHDLFLEENLSSPPVIVLIVCGIICLISFFGCCGVIRENKCCLYLFSLLMLVVIVVEVVAGVYVFMSRTDIAHSVEVKMQDLMKGYNESNPNSIKQSWDALQHDFGCCGVKNYTDWDKFLPMDKRYPHSCCHNLPLDQRCQVPQLQNVPGCFSRFSQFVQTKTLTLAVIVLSVGILQLLCAVASGLLARHFQRQYEAV